MLRPLFGLLGLGLVAFGLVAQSAQVLAADPSPALLERRPDFAPGKPDDDFYSRGGKPVGDLATAEMRCIVGQDLTLKRCSASFIFPETADFKAAALSFAEGLRATTAPEAPRAGETVHFSIVFKPESGPSGPRVILFQPWGRLPPPGPPPVNTVDAIVDTAWDAWPTPEAVADAYPSATAGPGRVKGVVVLQCRLDGEDRPSGCAVWSENLPGYGFGVAALRLASAYHAVPASTESPPEASVPESRIGGRVRLLITLSPPPLPSGQAEPPPIPQPKPTAGGPNVAIWAPIFVNKPSGGALGRFFPERAQRMEVSGRAVLACTIDSQGYYTDCSVVEDYPSGYGFGAAALKSFRYTRVGPTDGAGFPTAGRPIVAPMNFRLGN